jgi:hypothetical protein
MRISDEKAELDGTLSNKAIPLLSPNNLRRGLKKLKTDVNQSHDTPWLFVPAGPVRFQRMRPAGLVEIGRWRQVSPSCGPART